jgi:hypothetical protein
VSLPAGERDGLLFARRLAGALAATPDAVPLGEWFRLYRLVVPVRPNGRGSPRQLEEALRARAMRAQRLSHREVAIALGYLARTEVDAARAERRRDAPGARNIERVKTAERRVRRNEKLLVACEERIVDAGLVAPAWLTASPAK